jgi:DNA-binding MarR family transcriptional regulator
MRRKAVKTTEGKLTPAVGACFGTAMRKATRRLTQLYDEVLQPCGLRSTQIAILGELARSTKEPPTMAELARAMVMDRSALGHNLRPLERDGLIALQESEDDRRRRHVALTPVGKAKIRDALTLWQTAQDRFVKVFGESEAESLRATLLRIAYDERLATLKD